MSESPVRAERGSVESTVEALEPGQGWSVTPPPIPPSHVYLAVESTEDAVVVEVCASLDEGLRVLVERISDEEWAGWLSSGVPEEERSALPTVLTEARTVEARRTVLASYWGDPVEDGPDRFEYGAGMGSVVYVERRAVRRERPAV